MRYASRTRAALGRSPVLPAAAFDPFGCRDRGPDARRTTGFGRRSDERLCAGRSEVGVARRRCLQTFVPITDHEPSECPATGFGHDSQGCVTCLRRRAWVRRAVEEEEQAEVASMRVSGGYLFDIPTDAPIWGTPEVMLSAEQQGWMMARSDGTGKTSCACQYVRLGLG